MKSVLVILEWYPSKLLASELASSANIMKGVSSEFYNHAKMMIQASFHETELVPKKLKSYSMPHLMHDLFVLESTFVILWGHACT